MTLRKRWPNEADWARLDAIALAQRIEALAAPISDGASMTEIERIQRAGQICRHALNIINHLQAVGPQQFKKDTNHHWLLLISLATSTLLTWGGMRSLAHLS